VGTPDSASFPLAEGGSLTAGGSLVGAALAGVPGAAGVVAEAAGVVVGVFSSENCDAELPAAAVDRSGRRRSDESRGGMLTDSSECAVVENSYPSERYAGASRPGPNVPAVVPVVELSPRSAAASSATVRRNTSRRWRRGPSPKLDVSECDGGGGRVTNAVGQERRSMSRRGKGVVGPEACEYTEMEGAGGVGRGASLAGLNTAGRGYFVSRPGSMSPELAREMSGGVPGVLRRLTTLEPAGLGRPAAIWVRSRALSAALRVRSREAELRRSGGSRVAMAPSAGREVGVAKVRGEEEGEDEGGGEVRREEG
jgi:hypothetical protein